MKNFGNPKRCLVAVLVLLQGIQHTTAHYNFPFVIVNGIASKRWEYVRPTTSFEPVYDYAGPDAMCGHNATKALYPVKTLKVEAGSTVTFGVGEPAEPDESTSTKEFRPEWTIYHSGPAAAYLSKAPGEPNEYQGDGDWFKIDVIGAKDGLRWDIDQSGGVNMLNFTIPHSTPPGKYLLRAEHLFIWTDYGLTQMYPNCAHIEISGPGGGTPGPTTKFPGAFDASDPGIWLPNALAEPIRPQDRLKNWEGAGPKVWRG